MNDAIFTGCIPALMTPCTADRQPDFDALVAKGRELIELGMSELMWAADAARPSSKSRFSAWQCFSCVVLSRCFVSTSAKLFGPRLY